MSRPELTYCVECKGTILPCDDKAVEVAPGTWTCCPFCTGLYESDRVYAENRSFLHEEMMRRPQRCNPRRRKDWEH